MLERLLFNKICLTYSTASKKNAFDHRLRERCLGDRSYRYRTSRVQHTLDELYAENLKTKTFKGFAKVLKVRSLLRKNLDLAKMAMRKLRDLVGIDPADFEATTKKDMIQLKHSFSTCLDEQKSLEIQARHLSEYLRLDKLQRNKNIEAILKGTIGLFSGLFKRH